MKRHHQALHVVGEGDARLASHLMSQCLWWTLPNALVFERGDLALDILELHDGLRQFVIGVFC